jgi:transcription-repair coupling factor (superfamily II helicase)
MSADRSLWTPILEAPFFERVERCLRGDERPLCLSGLVEGSRALVLSLLAGRTGRPLMLVVPDDAALDAYRRDLVAVAGLLGRRPERVVLLPALDADPYDGIPPHPEIVRERVVALGRLFRRDLDVLILPVRALLQWLPSPEEWAARTRTIRKGDELPPERFVLEAMGTGYKRVDTVSSPGELSRRGGIIDIFPPDADEPVRIELFGDFVDSLRSFDTDHQRSTGPLDEAVVGPAAENPPTDDALGRLSDYLETAARKASREGGSVRDFRRLLTTLENESYWPGIEALAGLCSAAPALVLDYAGDLALVVDEPRRSDEELIRSAHELRNAYAESGDRVFPPPERLFADPRKVRARLEQASLYLQELVGDAPAAASVEVTIVSRSARAYAGRVAELVDDLREELAGSRRVVCVMRTRGSAERLGEILGEYDLGVALVGDADAGADLAGRSGLLVLVAGLRTGFELPELGLTVLSEREVFGEERKTAERKRGRAAAFFSDFRDLKEGDAVVHVDHGVAVYTGLGRPKGGSLNRDFMVLEFAAGDKLFVPVDRLDLVQKYRGVAGRKAQLDKLGGVTWERIKKKVRKSVESMARQLLELYARRRSVRGHAFGADGEWQKELEDAFPFELTPDQQTALGEVKQDMESDRPMDRLLVGDVGFGKTEVAVRAAFKAVMDGRQVAVLAPTTVLAFQHFETFRNRYAPFPVKVEMVSRFRSPREIREILARVATGEVDVLIGTHRLLSRDVAFPKLGLLVVDEEQRFGVAHKERLKELSIGIDVMAMTATPIPRTLQMSLAGVRDLSIIQTPPPGRMAIQTYLVPFRKNVVAQALRQELRRDGQAFVVHNRVETLPALTRAIRELVPEARVVMAHGQMAERQLEDVMLRFVRQEADVLVTTTIIENGLDIPRTNTIIVNRADRFGLAQLYQLRGRVGRSAQHAYAFFLVPSRETLSDPARKRLRALQEFSDLGAGFRLAAADLEIRGAGEFLGTRQHGHIASLGFDLYCQMLERAVNEMQGGPVDEPAPPSLHLGVDIKVPDSYMLDAGDRLALYKRLAGLREPHDVDRIQSETEDRYGHLPPPAVNLFEMTRVRLAAQAAGVRAVDIVDAKLQIRFHQHSPLAGERVVRVLDETGGRLSPSGMMVLPAPDRATDRLAAIRSVLDRLLDRAVGETA